LKTFFADPIMDLSSDSKPNSFVPSKAFIERLSTDAILIGVFAWMGILYGPFQYLRIVTQDRRFAVLDQWFTLPFFAWVSAWCIRCVHPKVVTWPVMGLIEVLSLLSYTASFASELGFDTALGIHILITVSAVIYLIQTFSAREDIRAPFFCALACCLGFVGLKLADHRLALFHDFFTVLSGHFFSKICDAFQIHFVCLFFHRFNRHDYVKQLKDKRK